jgi:Holliday junction resolvasome RuvABC DNA-binding subunit
VEGARSALVRASAKAASGSAESAIFLDAKSALIGLGYREQDVHQLLNRVMAEAKTPPKRAEELIRAALRQLAQ